MVVSIFFLVYFLSLCSASGLTIDEKLFVPDAEIGESFASSLALSSNTLFVGSHSKNMGGLPESGVVYIFTKYTDKWRLIESLTPNEPKAFNHFGASIAISGDTVVIGATQENLNDSYSPGLAYVYVKDGNGAWDQQQILTSNDGNSGDLFGSKVSIHGDTIAVTAINKQDEAVYVYERRNNKWSVTGKLNLNVTNLSGFGTSLSVLSNAILVGAPEFSGNGRAFFWVKANNNWEFRSVFEGHGTDFGDQFGKVVVLNGKTALISAPKHKKSGAVYSYLFDDDSKQWELEKVIRPFEETNVFTFGQSLAIDGDVAIVGATLIYGSIYIYTRGPGEDPKTTWNPLLRWQSQVSNDHFASNIDIKNMIVSIGAPTDGSGIVYVGHLNASCNDFYFHCEEQTLNLEPDGLSNRDKLITIYITIGLFGIGLLFAFIGIYYFAEKYKEFERIGDNFGVP